MRLTMRPALRYLRDAAVFAPCYVVLDWASYIDPVGPFNITPWNPQPALAIAWMMLGGLQHAPAVLAAIFCADLLVRGAPAGYGITLAGALILACGYAAIAAALRALMSGDMVLSTTRQLTLFTALVVAGSASIGAVFVGVLHGAGLLASSGFGDSWMRFWIGDSVGMLVTTPLLLLVADAARRRALLALARRPESLLQLTVLMATLWLVFSDMLGEDPSRHFYLLFAPLIWIAARMGLSGAVAASAIVQLGVVLGMQGARAAVPAIELQALVAAFTLTGLYLGMMVEERENAAESLRQTLRLAAAGETAGAIAHEVNQPLTALTNYGRAAQSLIGGARAGDPRLMETVEKMLAEAQRAADIVRRLRDLFREGTTLLERVRVEELLEAVQRIGAQLIGSRPVALTISAEPGLAALYVDRLQIELVLRNLIANAVEAIGESAGQVAIKALHQGADQVRFVVADSGPGVAAGIGARLFEPFRSGKPRGMGLGLAISRAIAEAHGGALVAHGSGHGEFHLTLPCAAAED
jgi:two-component system sensor kinase FixL